MGQTYGNKQSKHTQKKFESSTGIELNYKLNIMTNINTFYLLNDDYLPI